MSSSSVIHDADPIVICGMAVRLPGGVKNTQDFWDLMINKRSGLIPIPKDRWNLDGFYSPEPRWGTIQNKECYMLNDRDLTKFDASYFSCGEKEIERMDPMQRQLLEITRECLDNAGETKWRGREIGCYVGNFSSDWQDDLSMDPHASGLYRGSGYLDFLQPNRVSYEFGWTGPSMLVKTGCSSSMVALHLAAEAVQNGTCDSAMALGCNLITSVITSIVFTETGVLSPSGKCKSFDLLADGYGRGEAVNAVFVKKLSDVLRDGNPIRAVIRSSGTNNDGRSNGIMNPNTHLQEALIRRTYEKAGITDYSKTAFFECHGTGTPTGDPLEVAAVARIWKDHGGVKIGAVKPNVGHSEGAAGLTSIIKGVLALENRVIPPNIYLENPNPRIPWEEAKLSVPTEPEPWPQDKYERISVNSFGVAGSNAHVILESYEGWLGMRKTRAESPSNTEDSGVDVHAPGPRLLLFSASHMKSLKDQVEQHQKYLQAEGTDLDNLAYTLGLHRDHLNCRTYAVVDEDRKASFDTSTFYRKPATSPRTVFVFTGQGVHWAGMGKVLLKTNKAFGDSIRKMDRWLRSLPEAYKPDWTIRAELLKDPESTRLGHRGFSHPCATAVQIALVDLLSSLGIYPEAVTGHSGGEAAAAYAAGSISAEAAMAVAYFRGWILINDKAVPPGTMAAVGLGAKDVTPFLIPGVVIGCENSPVNTTLSGDPVCIQHCVDQIQRRHPDVTASVLKLETSFHSPWIEPLGEPYEELLKPYLKDAKAPHIPHFSSVTGKEMTGDEFGAEYFRKNFVQTVLFSKAMKTLLSSNPNNLFIEVGPHPALQAPVKEIFRDHPEAEYEYIATLRRGDDQKLFLHRLAGELFTRGLSPDLTHVIPAGVVLTDLPTYPWLHDKTYFDEPRNPSRYKARRYPRHDLLGARVVEGNDIEPAWRNMLDLKEASWLQDHVVNGQVVFPGAAYAAMMGEAIRQVSDGQDAYTIQNMRITTPLTLPQTKKMETYTRLIPEDAKGDDGEQWYNFKIMSCDGQHWVSHCSGMIRSGANPDMSTVTSAQAEIEFPRKVSTEGWYSSVKKLGIEWRTAFQGLDDISADTVSQQASATVYDFDDTTHYSAHPTLLDQMLQTNLIAMTHGLRRRLDDVVLPTCIGRLAVLGSQDLRMRVYGAIDDSASGKITARSAIYTEEGRLTVYMDNLEFGVLPAGKKEEPLLGSYFEWRQDITLLDSVDQVEPSEPQVIGSAATTLHREEFKEIIYLLGFKIPDARVLEIGTGSIDWTRTAIGALHPAQNQRFYSRYTYASVSDNDVDEVSKGFEDDYTEIQDVTVGGIEQISLSDGADIVIVPAPTLATEDDFVLDELEALKTLVQAGGRVVVYHPDLQGTEDMSEMAEMVKAASQQLENLGFGVRSHSKTGVIVAQGKIKQKPEHTITVLSGKSENKTLLAERVKLHFEEMGSCVKISHDGTIPNDSQVVISLLDLEGTDNTVHSLNGDTFRGFMDSICNFSGSLIWALPSVHAACARPHTAMIQGLARTVRMEYKIDITLVEIDDNSISRADFAKPIWKICEGLDNRRKGGDVDADCDFAIMDGVVQIPRMRWFDFKDPMIGNAIPTSPTAPIFKDNVSYLLIGGFGGLGRSVATWMVEHGARNLVFLSRSAKSPENEQFVKELEGYHGCTVATFSGDVSKTEDVLKAIKGAPKPIAGVFQLSLVLRDNATKSMTFQEWSEVVRPRVDGTWNVHQSLIDAGAQLDFFVVFGSGGGHTGYYGQANYTSANTFLDAFIEYRHGLGLPASIIDLGVVGDVGYLLEQDHLFEGFKNGGFYFLTEQQVLNAAAISVNNSHSGPLSSFCLGGLSEKPMNDPTNRVNWKRDVRFAVSHHFHRAKESSDAAHQNGKDGNEADRFLSLAKTDPEQLRDAGTITSLARFIATALGSLMLRPVEDFSLTETLTAIGLDSIISIELVDWIQQQFHIGLSSMEITSCTSLLHLADKIVGEISKA